MKHTSNKNLQTCKLCLENKQLCNSHIIPDLISEINAEEINRFNCFVGSMRAKGVFEKEWK